ncbi:unnamed protein product [Clonostachys rhizophaga]|uniref:AB hydrolase-1 domain-containing protein n=1 Tax=Clonostachys rhizophaga TaxID=160324 RepID=A0A9N9YPT1_9HYPO|nr:unnamed protein product [Clonostachys rhizophaga]
MTKKPTVVFLPGSFASDEIYFDVRDAVIKRGVDARVLPLPSVRLGPDDHRPPPNMFDDAAAISQEVERLADEGRDVILVSSSYSGVPKTQSCEGLGRAERERNGKSGGLATLAYMSAIIPQLDQASTEILVDVPLDHVIPMDCDDDGWLKIDPIDYAHSGFLVFSNLPKDQQMAWARKTAQHSSKAFGSKVTFLSYTIPEVALEVLFSENDKVISPKNQRLGIERLEKYSGKTVGVTSVAGDHAPHISMQEQVVDWLVKIAETC